MISAATIALVNAFKDPILSGMKDIGAEAKYFFDSGLPEYIENLKSKFENTKTFLYRNETVSFYDTFFNVSLKHNHTVTKSLNELFKKSNFATIIGNAGSGKTMLIKHLFLNSIKNLSKIPIFIELRNLNDYDLSFVEYVNQVIFDSKISTDKKILERLLNTGHFVFLLDGYDEIYSNKKNKITSDLDKFIDKHSKNNFVISSRPGSGIESLPRFNNFFVQPLSDKEIFLFIDLVLKGIKDNQLASKIKAVITKPENSDYKDFLSSPLLLSMFILTFNTYPELPKKKSKFYWNVFDTLATKHDSFTKKGGYQHERKTGLQNDEFEEILQWFSYISLFDGKFNFDSQYLTNNLNNIKKARNLSFNTSDLIEDLTLAIAIIIVDGIEYNFPHKSLQEYFCANLIKNQEEENKIKIYSSKFSRQLTFSTGGYENFWNLCYELDYHSFLKNFILANLVSFLDQFENLDPLMITKKIYKGSNFSDNIKLSNNTILRDGGYSYTSVYGNPFQVAKYLNLNDISILSFSKHYNNPKFVDYFTKNKSKFRFDEVTENYSIEYQSLWDSDLEEVFIATKQIDVIKNCIENFRIKVKELQSELSNITDTAESLLKIN